MAASLADYFQRLRGEGWQVEQGDREARFSVEIDGAVLSGSIDWLERHPDGRVRVVDLKTGKHVPGTVPGLGNLQLRAYQQAVALGAIDGIPDGAPTEARLLMPKLTRKQKTIESEPYDEVADAFREHVQRAIETMGGARFAAQPAVHCTDRYRFGQCRIHVIPEVTA